MKKRNNWVCVLWGVSTAVIIAACAGGAYNFRRSYDVSRIFEDHNVLPDYRYYISGNSYKPLAIVGLRKEYRVDSPHWQQANPDSEQLADWMLRLLNQPGAEYNLKPNGARILDNQGSPIGIWYSVWALPRLSFKSENVIDIGLPMTVFPPSNYNPEDDGLLGIWPR